MCRRRPSTQRFAHAQPLEQAVEHFGFARHCFCRAHLLDELRQRLDHLPPQLIRRRRPFFLPIRLLIEIVIDLAPVPIPRLGRRPLRFAAHSELERVILQQIDIVSSHVEKARPKATKDRLRLPTLRLERRSDQLRQRMMSARALGVVEIIDRVLIENGLDQIGVGVVAQQHSDLAISIMLVIDQPADIAREHFDLDASTCRLQNFYPVRLFERRI